MAATDTLEGATVLHWPAGGDGGGALLSGDLPKVTSDAAYALSGVKSPAPPVVALFGLLGIVTGERGLGSTLALLTANDEQALAFHVLGGNGCICVTANVASRLCATFQDACARGDCADARRLHDILSPLHAALFSDASPGPVKDALTRVRPGFPPNLRLPMTWPSAESRRAVDTALESAGLIPSDTGERLQ